MAYNLLYSRQIRSDAVIRITDVLITERSLMIEILSLISPLRRVAGYAYALCSDGITDYERSGGVTLPFGKNRVNFTTTNLPYGLEFFPRYGVKSGIISVYTGEPSPPPPPPSAWKPIPSFDVEFRLAQSPNRIEYRKPIGSSIIQSMAAGAIQGCLSPNGYVGWKTSGPAGYAYVPELPTEYFDSDANHAAFMAAPDSIML